MLNNHPTGIVVSDANSRTGELAGSGTFVGEWEDIRKYAETTVNVFGTPSVAPGTLFFEYSPDGVNADVSVPYVLSGPQSFVPLPLRTVLPYFRIRYTNGATALTALRITTVYHWESAKHITRVINQVIDENEPVENIRAFIGGKSPDGPFTNVPASGVATLNSSNTPLGSGGVFTGTVISTLGFVAASVAVKSNQNSASMGIVFSFYADLLGTRLLKTAVFTYGSAPNGTAFQVPAISGPYMRVSYTNGAVAQSTFELLTTLSVTAPPSDVLSISETINANTAAQITKSSIVGQQENGVYANSKLSNSGSQMVAIADRPDEVRGRTAVIIPVNRTTVSAAAGGSVLYTVTGGKVLYVSAFIFTTLNDDAAIGEWRLRDSTTVKSAFLMAQRTLGNPVAASAPSPTLPQPIRFATNVNAILITGTIFLSGFLIGYEE